MADTEPLKQESGDESRLSVGTYEIIRNRLKNHSDDLNLRLQKLNQSRKSVFGAIESSLITQERVSTDNNCIPRDMFSVGDKFLFGYNVYLGLKSTFQVSDVFSVYTYQDHTFRKIDLDLLSDKQFQEDFKNLYNYYKETYFSRFTQIGTSLFMVFTVGKEVDAVKTFKWVINDNHTLTYVNNRSDHECKFPPQHEFEWRRVGRDQHRKGLFPHISIEDRIFVETIGGDLTVKIEDNTDTGAGIYSEPVDDPDQTLDDAEIYYASVGNLILLKMRPYRENAFRYIVFNEKVKEARRIDTIKDACVLLPEDQGIIFANGYYLQNGEYKLFESDLVDMLFQRRIASPNGEDTLFVFFNRARGIYMLFSYNIIEQSVATPTICNGYSIFENGEMLFFRSDEEPKKNHPIQIWRTPYTGADFEAPIQSDSYLFKLGNRDIVRCMAACRNVLSLVAKEESYANVYVDIVRETTEVLDTYFWLDKADAENLREPLDGIRAAAEGAVDEFEKVVRVKKNTAAQTAEVKQSAEKTISQIASRRFETINDFVELLGSLRAIRGQVIGLKDLRYADLTEIANLESSIEKHSAGLAERCVAFLLNDASLDPYIERVQKIALEIDALTSVKDAKALEQAIGDSGKELEMLIEIVSNLKIDDAKDRTKIINSISDIYANLNQNRSRATTRLKELASSEGKAEFGSQMKLLDQAVINYINVCDTPAKCDEYLTKITVQIGELEGRFSDFDEFIVELTDKRDDVYAAFESKKLALVEARNKKTDAYLRSAERILSGISTRTAQFKTGEEIKGYFASDLMVDKVRDIIAQLRELGDNVKADDIQSRLKTVTQDALRQLRDQNELFVDGKDVIRFGEHNFSVNTQALALTVIDREDGLYLHLTGTDFFEKIEDPRIETTRRVWHQQIVSEDDTVYRAEYLAFQMLVALRAERPAFEKAAFADRAALLETVRAFMAPRYAEGYVKGIHDVDAAAYLQALLAMESAIGLLRISPQSRALAMLYWFQLREVDPKLKETFNSKFQGVGALASVFGGSTKVSQYIDELEKELTAYLKETALFEQSAARPAAEYLFEVLRGGEKWAIHSDAAEIVEGLVRHLERRGAEKALRDPLSVLSNSVNDALSLLQDWVSAYIVDCKRENLEDFRDEAAVLILTGMLDRPRVVAAKTTQMLEGLVGDHPVVRGGKVFLDYNRFITKMIGFEQMTRPLFEAHQALKKEIVEKAAEALRLSEFEPKILSSFVRNRLIDTVYLPLIGNNLAKQIGTVGTNTRTDRMGLLLLISPPGYGKTTLMEYIANRLGLIFMKINGPAVGRKVTSLDPKEAPNAAAAKEMEKLNLSLEMGDNVMIYLDDIQHCNPEFLQKFISLCDAQRKIEGVYKGRPKTYDFRGKRVCVVMAGNPYSESGEAFKIPDMLANRADTYNLGDIIGGSREAFELSYIENALTSSSTLSSLADKNFKDIYALIHLVATGSREGIEFEGAYSADEIEEYIAVMKKLMTVRDIILKVNQSYIYSAAQADAYRTEPPFKLQGSYRNMNRIAEKVLPILNDKELSQLISDHYQSESQTLTTQSEANLLKFKELFGTIDDKEKARWKEICRTFNRNQLLGNNAEDPLRQAIAVLSTFKEGLDAIRETLSDGIIQMASNTPIVLTEPMMPMNAPAAPAAAAAVAGTPIHAPTETRRPPSSPSEPAETPETPGSNPPSDGTIKRKIIRVDHRD